MVIKETRLKVILALYLWVWDYLDWVKTECPMPDNFDNYLKWMFQYQPLSAPADDSEILF